MKKNLLLIAIMALMGIFEALGAATWIHNISPKPNEFDVSRNTDISIVFNQDINSESLSDLTIRVNGSQSGLHRSMDIRYSDSTRTVIFDPDEDFFTRENVSVTLTNEIYNVVGDTMTAPHSWQFTIGSTQESSSYIVESIIDVGFKPWSISPGDFDNDGDVDLGVANESSGSISILYNGIFTNTELIDVGHRPYSIITGDYDSDGDLDLAVAVKQYYYIKILLNDGEGNFSESSEVILNSRPVWIIDGDFDNDGDLDLASAIIDSNVISILINDGHANFIVNENIPIGKQPRSISKSDIDLDGDFDILSANTNDNTLSVFENNGHGRFRLLRSIKTDTGPRYIGTGDLNYDSFPDLVVANEISNKLAIYLNDKYGGFQKITSVNTGEIPESVVLFNYDGDDDLDLIFPNQGSNTISIFENKGDVVFEETMVIENIDSPRSIAASDFDKDGDLDFVVANLYANSITVLFNSSTLDVSNKHFIPEKFLLYQNYPNPFNPSTNIRYNLHESNNVKLQIFSLSGQMIETLIDGFQEAGAHKITWRPKGLASGIYFYKLRVGEFLETKKLILQK
ncbi:T9SS type A sorting domain-containing protein [candidate division KSB1 bacterium]|nr:T9SS type A sorting domain-containing protein [candidate division KSB1 bacterium]